MAENMNNAVNLSEAEIDSREKFNQQVKCPIY